MISTPHRDAAVAHLTGEYGRFAVAAFDGAVTHLLLPNAHAPTARDGASESDTSLATEAVRQLAEYLAGDREGFDLPYNPAGTEFQRAVWFALLDIDYGRTASYADLARTIGRPQAVRAVGAANGANPIAVFLPCHRVIGANGSLTGYGGGLELKQALLSLEAREARLPLG
jgi:methylated-DNA-[protein]-cysteine S-methyltransferase